MDNALLASSDLNLVFGVTLTKEQINRLTQDIVWMEEQTIQGYKVLVPRVYFANLNDDNHRTRGGQILASNIDITTNAFVNTGDINAKEHIRVASAKDISNLGGSIRAGKDIQLRADNKLTNQSGTISGHNVTLVAKQINIETATSKKDTKFGEGQTQTETLVHDKAKIEATDNINIVSLGNTDITGADIKSKAGDVNITSVAGSVNVKTAKKQDEHNINITGGYNRGNSVENITNNIEGENVSINASNANILLEGTKIDAKDNINLDAKTIALLSARDSKFQDDYLKTDEDFGMNSTLQNTIRACRLIQT